MDPNMVFHNGETGAQRMARFEREDRLLAEDIAKCEAEYHAKGYDKYMSMDEAQELVMRLMDQILED